MYFWKHWDVTHDKHVLCNPMSSEKIDELVNLLEPYLTSDSKILDIAMGKAELIIRLIEKYNPSAIGIDLSPKFCRDARENVNKRVPDSNVELLEMDGADYKPEELESFDMVSCLGASWIYGGYEGTLKYMMQHAKKGGIIISGEPYWKSKPPGEYIKIAHELYDDFGEFATHYENVQIGETLGLKLVYSIASNLDDWDRYIGLQWYSTNVYAKNNPDDPDLSKIYDKLDKEKEVYFKWERDLLGWAIYVFKK